jgi:hypothetical protein
MGEYIKVLLIRLLENADKNNFMVKIILPLENPPANLRLFQSWKVQNAMWKMIWLFEKLKKIIAERRNFDYNISCQLSVLTQDC